jgi:Kef-type K+ transport system membrane component KefB
MKRVLVSVTLVLFAVLPLLITQSNSLVLAESVSSSDSYSLQENNATAVQIDSGINNSEQSNDESHTETSVHHFGIVFAMFALVLIAGKLGNIVEKYGQPAVIGELLAGVALSALGYFGWNFISDIATNEVISFLAQFGALLLLFSIGLESNMNEMKKVGVRALIVALIGVVVPFVLGAFVLGPIFFADESSNARLFLGASLVATSVGITASVFRSLKLSKTRAAQTVLGAAVIDDVLGLIVLAVVSALVSGGDLTPALVAELTIKSFGFLGGALLLGTFVAKPISKFLSRIHTGIGMKLTLAIGFALVFGYLAELFGLEPIIGAFAAGLILDQVHFSSFSDPEILEDIRYLEADEKHGVEMAKLIKRHRHAHVEDLINSVGLIFIPVFFVFTGLQIDFGSLLQPKLYLIAGLISIVAVFTKFVAGFAAEGTRTEKMFVGMSMVPRGEVGLIFAATGSALGVLSSELFSTIVLVVIITTFVSPALIKILGKKLKDEDRLVVAKSKLRIVNETATTKTTAKKPTKIVSKK